ncbi:MULTISPECIES: TIGR03986 family CRISPR-associated RAMP protein [unclassified Thiocapsa]|uniref:TIGR03986 family type III CRISPR-associated RAMP protein n=1 Tax=unclassified Thiocapsa TaxID=2641286 RepID=UPI0035B33254
MAPPTNIDAPYNFVPLADWVHLPNWATRVSHDLPFRDGLCGQLDLTLTAHTPILVGREQIAASGDEPGQVYPYQLPDGRYALPGTALKGMIRNVLEIASFSRMNAVDDVRYGLRDISGGYVSNAYTGRVHDQLKTGFMRIGQDGLPIITPCAMVRLSHRALEEWLEERPPIFKPDRTVEAKYRRWSDLCRRHRMEERRIRFSLDDGEATRLGCGLIEGVPVFTGQISDSTRKNGKKRDFIFYDEDPTRAFALKADDWGDFLFIHGDEATRDAADMSWPGYWKQRFWNGEPVPVFYLRDAAKTRVGLAFMPRLAGDFSTLDMIKHTQPQHLDGQGRGPWDFAELLFGTVGDQSEKCLKGRVIFHHAVAAGAAPPEATEPTILNGPKPSYFPNYLFQEANTTTWTLNSRGGYATCLGTSEHPEPEIRGWKRYPARTQHGVQELTNEQRSNKRVQTVLHPLPAETVFHCRVVFHNLLPAELGGLCWALTWGGGSGLRHTVGMGKPFGFGQLSVKIEQTSIRPNAPEIAAKPWQQYCDAFIEHMEQSAQISNRSWRTSTQIKTLLGMADPNNANRFKGKLQHMTLEPKKGTNDFVKAKQAGLVLADYPQTDHPATWAEREAERAVLNRQIAEALAEQERQALEEKRKAEEESAFDALPPERKLIETTRDQLKTFLAGNEFEHRLGRDRIVTFLNALAKASEDWADGSQRSVAADMLEEAYNQIGWSDPGQSKKQREKKEIKRRRQIEQIRIGPGGS